MIDMIIVADDLTGALDSGVQLAQKGRMVDVIIYNDDSFFSVDSDAEVIVIDAESRHLSSSEAYNRIYSILSDKRFSSANHVYKKTDSALRGNIGAELSAAMDALNEKHINFIPAYPKLGRTTVNGIHYVNGLPLSESVFNDDLREPIYDSSIEGIIKKQTDKKVICMSDNFINSEGIRVYDSSSETDLKNIYQQLEKENDLKLAAGCAGFLEMYYPDCSKNKSPALNTAGLTVICGTTNPISKVQLDSAENNGAYRIKMDMQAIMSNGDWKEKLTSYINDYLMNSQTHNIKIFDSKMNGIRKEKMEQKIASGFGYVASEVLKNNTDDTLMVIGGDTLYGVMNQLGINSIKPLYELSPGVVVSKIMFDNSEKILISKSGGFGPPDLLTNI